MPIKILLKENAQTNSLFQRNIDELKKHYSYDPDIDINSITPENGKILTEIEIGNLVGMGGYGKVFNIVNSSLVIKFFFEGIDWQQDIHRMKKTADEIFSGKASLDKMHYFETGKCGPLHYVIMPRIIPFEKSITYEQDPALFNDVSTAVSMAAFAHSKTYADFREEFYRQISLLIKDEFQINKKQQYVDDYLKRLNALDETIHKILRVAYKAMKEEGGVDLHLGNLGFFPQKPDDWFFFDMF